MEVTPALTPPSGAGCAAGGSAVSGGAECGTPKSLAPEVT